MKAKLFGFVNRSRQKLDEIRTSRIKIAFSVNRPLRRVSVGILENWQRTATLATSAISTSYKGWVLKSNQLPYLCKLISFISKSYSALSNHQFRNSVHCMFFEDSD